MAHGSTPTSLTSGATNTGSAITTTASVTPTAYKSPLVFVAISASHGSSAFTDTTTVSGNGLTWSKVGTVISGNIILTVFVGYGTSSAGAITITLSQTPSGGRYNVWEDGWYEQADKTYTPYTTSGTGTSGSIALTVNGDGSRWFSVWTHATAEALTPDTTGRTWVEESDTGASSAWGLQTQYIAGNAEDTTHTSSWATSSAYMGIAFEVDVSGAAGEDAVIDSGSVYAESYPISNTPPRGVMLGGGEESEDGPASSPSGIWAILGGS